MSPPRHIDFLLDVANLLACADVKSAVPLVTLVKNVEPLVFKQSIGKETLDEWNGEIQNQLDEMLQTGEELTTTDWSDEFGSITEYVGDPDWYDDEGKTVRLAETFYSWAPFPDPKSIEKLIGLREEVGPFPDPEYGDEDRRERTSDTYWTIKRLFEDL